MASIVIHDLSDSQQLDQRAMAQVAGGRRSDSPAPTIVTHGRPLNVNVAETESRGHARLRKHSKSAKL